MDDRGHEFMGVLLALLCLTWVAVLLRFYTRACLIRVVAADDWCTLATQLLFTSHIALGLVSISFGAGRHVEDTQPKQQVEALKTFFYTEIFYNLTLGLFRITVGIFLLRITIDRTIRIIVYTLIGAVSVYTVVFTSLAIFQCTPVNFFWTRAIDPTTGTCDAQQSVNCVRAVSILGILTDVILGLLPVKLIWGLRLCIYNKIAVLILFGLSLVTIIAPIVRFKYLLLLTHTFDFLYAVVDVGIWSALEPGIGITAVCIATMRPLLTKMGVNTSFRSQSHISFSTSRLNKLSKSAESDLRSQSTRKSGSVLARILPSKDLNTVHESVDQIELLDNVQSGREARGTEEIFVEPDKPDNGYARNERRSLTITKTTEWTVANSV